MHPLLIETKNNLLAGNQLSREEAQALGEIPDFEGLLRLGDTIRRHFMGDDFHLCSIINARSGNCSEDCRFCAQSARHPTGVPTYPLIDREQALEQAADADLHGVRRLSLVTSGLKVDDQTLDGLALLYEAIGKRTRLDFCASMGLLETDKFDRLRNMGVTRYHCNVESSRNFFPSICTSHTYEAKVTTLQAARVAGLSLCSGGIIGMGETMADRIDMALELREMGVQSIPINILTPIAGTPFQDFPVLDTDEVLATIALFRLVNPTAVIRLAGGRQQLGRAQYRCFTVGANGAIVGNYLTTFGNSVREDLRKLSDLGFTFNR
jgi:biotin synthase